MSGSVTFEIGENRAATFGVPVWAGEWPVLVDGTEVAEIVETERGYRLRKAGVWIAPERWFRSSAEDDARDQFLTWKRVSGHPGSDIRYEETEIDGATWARVTVEGMVTYGPEHGTDRAYAEYTRLYNEKTREKNA